MNIILKTLTACDVKDCDRDATRTFNNGRKVCGKHGLEIDRTEHHFVLEFATGKARDAALRMLGYLDRDGLRSWAEGLRTIKASGLGSVVQDGWDSATKLHGAGDGTLY